MLWLRGLPTPASAASEGPSIAHAAPSPDDAGASDAEAGAETSDGRSSVGSGDADGRVLGDVTVFDDVPAVTRLDPALLDALRRAATDARVDGVAFIVNSGWRSPAYQAELLQEAVSEYGSEAEAARWVATPETSPHVSGEAVDIGMMDATDWLAQHGDAYGLCQIYANEMWHYELRPEAVEHGCPAPYIDPTHDPRMQG
ncbi:peptidase M15 [Agromyces protaetiae]|uniref:Peptidase M15 n=2 Tax=Agromyces protaetiae TaxID=2509455 RepID=A0A4P6FWD0_9MICO|nr:peptidase M15 [Agromyces protaetiae]